MSLIEIYRTKVYPFLTAEAAAELTGAEQAVEVLEAALRQPRHLCVGFVGESQVGKSSLVNALLGRTALPAGGIGPLTASATRVRFMEDPTLRVSYHGKRELHQLAFAIEAHLVRKGKAFAAAERTEPPDEAAAAAVPPDPNEIVGEDTGAAEARAEATRKMSYMIAQAKQLMTPEPATKGERVELSDEVALEALRAVLGHRIRCDPTLLARLEERIQAVRAKLGKKEIIRQSALASAKEFDRDLRLRAAGWLAPLVAGFEVGLNSNLLLDLEMTDLPGIGVVGDPAALHAQRFVTHEGGSLVLVMRNAGMTEELARLLEKTGVIRRLLFGGRDGRAPIHVVIVVTYLDNVAKERHSAAVEAADEPEDVESPDEIFQRLAAEMAARVREQIAVALTSSPSLQDLPSEQRERRDSVVRQLCQDLFIECVAAPDYAALTYRKQAASAPFLRSPEATGVPALQKHLQDLARSLGSARDAAVEKARTDLWENINTHLSAIGQIYAEGGGQAQAAWDSFRGRLSVTLHELRPQMAAFQGEALGVLRGEVPERIKVLCLSAEKVAATRLTRLRGYGKTLHYQSLNAALTRNGIWERKGLDFPESLTSAFVETIATAWEPEIIGAIRAALKEVATRSLTLVERLCEEAQKHDGRIVLEAQIEAQKKLLLQQAQTAVAWTKEKLESLREDVQQNLYETVLKPIEQACDAAAKRHANRHAGAKERILDTFQEGGQRAIEKATERARELLLEHYRRLLSDLNKGFLREHHDPVQAAFDALTNETLLRARRSDSQKRRRILDTLAEIDATLNRAVGAAAHRQARA